MRAPQSPRPGSSVVILLIDNYDSFVHNLARYFIRLGQETHVVRNDAVTPDAIRRMAPAAIVLSPGPCGPAEAGCCVDLVRQFAASVPILGVCLGHQAIAAAFDAQVVRAREPWHGRSCPLTHDGRGIFENVPSPLTVGRYHSLSIDEASLPPEFRVTARTGDGEIMAIAHVDLPVIGVQFHPESILTEHGYALLSNFLRMADLPVRPVDAAAELAPRESTNAAAQGQQSAGGTPVTF